MKDKKSYKNANPMRPDKKEGRNKDYKSSNPYAGKGKGKGKMSSKTKNPMK